MKSGVRTLSGEEIFLEGMGICWVSFLIFSILFESKRRKINGFGFLNLQTSSQWNLYVSVRGKILLPLDLSATSIRGLRGIWTSLSPQKAQILSWQLILGRLPTRSNLCRRWALPVGVTSDCVWCSGIWEVKDHLFYRCSFVGMILICNF